MDRYFVKTEALRIIDEKEIADDEEKQKIYDDVKRQFIEHEAKKETANTAEAKSSEITHKPDDPATEYEKGYQKFQKDQEEVDKFRASSYYQGYKAAEQEYLDRRVAKLSAIEHTENDSTNPVTEDPLTEELRQIKEDYKALDERLKALEKYTKE